MMLRRSQGATTLDDSLLTLARRIVIVVALVGPGGCTGHDSPTVPTGPTWPPEPSTGPPALTCPAAVSTPATSADGSEVSYTVPTAAGGRTPVTVTCVPPSGQRFVVGATTVTCTATDAAALTATCSFVVAVAPAPRLTRTRFLAFGDSITAGEVTVPVTLVSIDGAKATTIDRLQLVPSASYPAVLGDRLRQRYVAQTITVENAGKPGEVTEDAGPRFQGIMKARQPDVVFILVGYNDLEGGTRGVSRAISVVEQMVRTARDGGVRVFLATLTPGIPGRLRAAPEQTLLAYNDAIRALAVAQGVVLVDLYQAGVPNVDSWIGVDGLHPTEVGYAGMADVFYAAIRADLEVR